MQRRQSAEARYPSEANPGKDASQQAGLPPNKIKLKKKKLKSYLFTVQTRESFPAGNLGPLPATSTEY